MKHYIRLDGDKIIKGFSDAFESAGKDDVLLTENGGRHFALNGQENPPLQNEQGIPLYKYVEGKVVARTKTEIDADIALIPPPPPSMEEKFERLQTKLVEKEIITEAEKESISEPTLEVSQ